MTDRPTKSTGARTARWLTSKGMFVSRIGDDDRYVVEDAVGQCLLPRQAADLDALRTLLKDDFNIELLCPEGELDPMSSPESFGWNDLELYYVARLTDFFRYWQVGRRRVPEYDACRTFMPPEYEDWGFGDGGKASFEELDRIVRADIEAGTCPFSSEFLGMYLHHVQLRRICSDIMLLLHRATRSFYDVLIAQRRIVVNERWALAQLKTSEIVHSGEQSYRAASAATICAISLCTSLDLSSKLMHFLNRMGRPASRFRPAQGKHFGDLAHLQAGTLPEPLLAQIRHGASQIDDLAALTQMRHDVVHSTTALELERVCVGYQTAQVNGWPLHYAEIHWRDCGADGQPDRFLGRDYFTSQGADMDVQLARWIQAVSQYHVQVGELLLAFFESNIVDDVGVSLGAAAAARPPN